MVAEDLFGVRQWLDGVADMDAAPFHGGPYVEMKRSAAFARELVDRDDKDGRPPDDADLVVRALALLEGFAALPVGA